MSSRRAISLLALAIWVLLGPVAMAFGGCAVMGAMCEGPCGSASCAVFAPTLAASPEPVAYAHVVATDGHLPTNAVAGLDHPPRFFLSPSA